jgi:dTDP-4-amino-4,6-dideoxygalactose transaminase/lipopolysaccharide/colanic/teichoic acid biosynthesis glycosyltransferase
MMNPTLTKFLPFHAPLIEEDDIRAVREAMLSGWITTGPKSLQFEEDFARYIGVQHAVAVNSGTAALHLALEAIGLHEGDEVILPTLTFAATAEAVLYCKARPILVDCEPDTFNLDPVQVERVITPRTRAIIPVHFAGHPCDMSRLLKIAHEHGLTVIEDAAHALSARYRAQMVGTLGDITCFSFYATKNITTGEGGMATTNRREWADRMRMMRLHGISKDAWKRYSAEGSWRYEILAPGFKYNLTDMQAALGISQLAKCESMWSRRRILAQFYTDALGALDAFEVPSVRSDVQHAWHLYVLRVCPGVLAIHRDRLIEELKERGIGTSVHFIPLHLHPYYRETWNYHQGDFPVAEDYFNRCLSLPLYPAMSDDDQSRVIEALTEIARIHRRDGKKPPSSVPPHGADRGSGPTADGRNDAAPKTEEAPLVVTRQADAEQGCAHQGWYGNVGKRLLDIAGAIAGITCSLPILTICAFAVRLSSSGPIFFRQRRIGQGGRPFELFKFRTMRANCEGPRLTVAGDPRITRVGKWLRQWKLDELPQLVNVLKGDMSLVGPRPELPEYVATYNHRQKTLLAVKPGITSPASLTYIDEEAALAGRPDSEHFYLQELLPHKLEIDLAYCRSISLSTDLTILFATAKRLAPGKRVSAHRTEKRGRAAMEGEPGMAAASTERG